MKKVKYNNEKYEVYRVPNNFTLMMCGCERFVREHKNDIYFGVTVAGLILLTYKYTTLKKELRIVNLNLFDRLLL